MLWTEDEVPKPQPVVASEFDVFYCMGDSSMSKVGAQYV
jgi:hypothetical protein